MIKTLWESDAVSPVNGKPFFSVKMTDSWYVFGERNGVDSVAFILFDDNARKVALINERKPPLGSGVFMETAFGGSLDEDLSPREICIKEVREESGYIVEDQRVHDLGKVLVSTQMNQMCHLFLVDVTDLEQGETDLGPGEERSATVWKNITDIPAIEDWKAITILTKAILLDIV